MSEWKAKRFWDKADVIETDDGFSVTLDGRAVKTPAKRTLVVPTQALAQAIADEWQAQEGEINPAEMPFTRSANAALDKVATQRDEVAQLIAAYGDSDLLCYRADGPESLIARQARAWDPMLDWAESDLNAKMHATSGLMHQPQSSKTLESLTNIVTTQDIFALTSLHDLVGLTGSLILGLAAQNGVKPPEEIWEMSRIDERWQAEQWGNDDEAQEAEALKKKGFEHAHAFYTLSRKP